MMQIYHYNQQLVSLRKKKNLSIKEASKRMNISRISLYLYEMGYIHPNKKKLEIIERFYDTKIDFNDDKDYPGPIVVNRRNNKQKKLFLFSIITIAISIVAIVTGSILLNTSTHNSISQYGETYIALKEKADKEGKIGRDPVTEAEYSYVLRELGSEDTSICFYKIDSMLYFNECVYSATIGSLEHPEFGIGRFHYRFGGNLGENSYRCFFDFDSKSTGDYFTCSTIYKGGYETGEIENLNRKVVGSLDINEEYARTLFDICFEFVIDSFDRLLSDSLGKPLTFYDDFLPAREKGRIVNYNMQVVGLSLLFPFILFLFLSLYILGLIFVKTRKSYLISLQEENSDSDIKANNNKLPKDIHLLFVIPDKVLIYSCNIIKYIAFIFIVIGFLAKYLWPLPPFFADPTFLSALRNIFVGTTFLKQFAILSSLKQEKSLWFCIINNLILYFFYASIETAVVGVFDMWGYSISDFIYNYIPGGVYQILALNYFIYLFLFFKPKFVKEKYVYIWRLLSIVPLIMLITCLWISNSYELIYGVEKNIYLKFWFPEALSTIAMISVIFTYITFFLRLILKKKYGGVASGKFLFSNRYMVISNMIYIALIILLVVLDIFVLTDQYFYYLGFRNNYWLLLLIPFVFFLKCSPSTMEQIENDMGL